MFHKKLHLLYELLNYFKLSATRIWLLMQEYDDLNADISLEDGRGTKRFADGSTNAYVLWIDMVNRKGAIDDLYTALKALFPKRTDDIDKVQAATKEETEMSKEELRRLFK